MSPPPARRRREEERAAYAPAAVAMGSCGGRGRPGAAILLERDRLRDRLSLAVAAVRCLLELELQRGQARSSRARPGRLLQTCAWRAGGRAGSKREWMEEQRASACIRALLIRLRAGRRAERSVARAHMVLAGPPRAPARLGHRRHFPRREHASSLRERGLRGEFRPARACAGISGAHGTLQRAPRAREAGGHELRPRFCGGFN
mgnify:FL=1